MPPSACPPGLSKRRAPEHSLGSGSAPRRSAEPRSPRTTPGNPPGSPRPGAPGCAVVSRYRSRCCRPPELTAWSCGRRSASGNWTAGCPPSEFGRAMHHWVRPRSSWATLRAQGCGSSRAIQAPGVEGSSISTPPSRTIVWSPGRAGEDVRAPPDRVGPRRTSNGMRPPQRQAWLLLLLLHEVPDRLVLGVLPVRQGDDVRPQLVGHPTPHVHHRAARRAEPPEVA